MEICHHSANAKMDTIYMPTENVTGLIPEVIIKKLPLCLKIPKKVSFYSIATSILISKTKYKMV